MSADSTETPAILRVDTYKDTRYSNPLGSGFNKIANGSSSGHIALSIEFDANGEGTTLYNYYIKDSKIPCSEVDGRYQAYISFHPANVKSKDKSDRLVTPLRDRLYSLWGTKFAYNDRAAKYLDADAVATHSPIPFLNAFRNKFTIGPTSIIHTTLMPHHNPDGLKILDEFAKSLEYLEQQYINGKMNEDECVDKIAEQMIGLKTSLFGKPDMSDDDIFSELDKFMTIGLPARDSTTIKLVPGGVNAPGLSLERVLMASRAISDELNKEQYNFLSYNCACVVHDILIAGMIGDAVSIEKMNQCFDPKFVQSVLGLAKGILTPFHNNADPLQSPPTVINNAAELNKVINEFHPELLGQHEGPPYNSRCTSYNESRKNDRTGAPAATQADPVVATSNQKGSTTHP